TVVDEKRTFFHRTMLGMLAVFSVAVIGWLGYLIWADRYDRIEPPKAMSFAPVPVKIGNEPVLLGVQLSRWDVPPRLNALYDRWLKLQLEEQLRLLDEMGAAQREE